MFHNPVAIHPPFKAMCLTFHEGFVFFYIFSFLEDDNNRVVESSYYF